MKTWRPAFLALAIACLPAAGRGEPEKSSNKAIYLYQGADREQKLLANAQKEGTLTLYTVMNLKDSGPLVDAFRKKYGIQVNLWRSNGEKLVQRALLEARANRHAADVIQVGQGMEMLYREKLLEEFHSPHFRDLPAAALPRHRHYAADCFYFYVVAYNSKLVKPEQLPASYADFLQPRWAGGFGLDTGDIDWFGAMVKAMGEEKGVAYFTKLAAMKPQLRSGHTLLAELVASGEIPVALAAFNHSVEQLKERGAPIGWKPLPPTFGRAQSIGLAKHAPHPHAALLFADFVLSKDGQQIVKDSGRVPASTAVQSPLNRFEYRLMDPVIGLDEWDKWSRLWSDLFLGGKAPAKGE